VYAKTPLAGPEVVLDYLSRYTHRVAVSNERIVGIDAKGVRLRVRADEHGGKRTTVIDGETFIARFLQHVLPPGFKRIRHYGLLSAAAKTERLAKAREALAMPAANVQAREDAAASIKRVAGIEISCCPHCHHRGVAGRDRQPSRQGRSVQGAAVIRRGVSNVARIARRSRCTSGFTCACGLDATARACERDRQHGSHQASMTANCGTASSTGVQTHLALHKTRC